MVWEHTAIGRELREERQGHKAAVLWFTGLSGSGKSTMAQQLERRLFALGCQVIYLDGDNVRHGLNGDLGFSAEDRKENIRRVAEVAKLTFENGHADAVRLYLALCRRAAICALAAACRAALSRSTSSVTSRRHNAATRKVCMPRRMRGEIRGFTGVDEPYETPQYPELICRYDEEHARGERGRDCRLFEGERLHIGRRQSH